MSAPIVLSVCDRTGRMVQPWADAGYECWIVDLQHPAGEHRSADGIVRVGADVTDWLPPRRDYAFAAGFPPCTDLSVSGARWFRTKGLGSLADALRVFDACRRIVEWTGAWMLENPVSTVSTYWRSPDHHFDPCDFAGYLPEDEMGDEAYTKRTCLWTGGGFRMPAHRYVLPLMGSKMHLLPPSADRADLRSVTPSGFARAVFEANAALEAPHA